MKNLKNAYTAGLLTISIGLSITRVASAQNLYIPQNLIKNYDSKPATKVYPQSKSKKSNTTISPALINNIQKSNKSIKATPATTKNSTILASPSITRFNPATLTILQDLGAKAKSGTATQSELDELMQLCNQATDNSSANSGGSLNSNKGSSNINNIAKWNNDFSGKSNESWNQQSNKKGGGSAKFSFSKGISLGGSGGSASSNKGSKSNSQTNKQTGSSDRTRTSSNESSYQNSYNNQQARIAQKECDAVLALMGTKDTNKTTIETTKLQLEDNKAQRKHEQELMKMRLKEERRARESQQQQKWSEMGAGLLDQIFSGGSNNNEPDLARESELESLIIKQQQQIDALLEKIDSDSQ